MRLPARASVLTALFASIACAACGQSGAASTTGSAEAASTTSSTAAPATSSAARPEDLLAQAAARLAEGDTDSARRLYDRASPAATVRLVSPRAESFARGHDPRPAWTLVWSPDSSRVGLRHGDRLSLLEAPTFRETATLTVPADTALALSDDGALLAVAHGARDPAGGGGFRVDVVRTATGTAAGSVAHVDGRAAMRFSRDGKTFACVIDLPNEPHFAISIFDVMTGSVRHTLRAAPEGPLSESPMRAERIDLDEPGQLRSEWTDGFERTWKLDTGELLGKRARPAAPDNPPTAPKDLGVPVGPASQLVNEPGEVDHAMIDAWSPDHRWLARETVSIVGDLARRTLRLFDVAARRPVLLRTSTDTVDLFPFAFTKDGEALVALTPFGGQDRLGLRDSSWAHVPDVVDPALLPERAAPRALVGLTPTGDTVVLTQSDARVAIPSRSQSVVLVPSHPSPVPRGGDATTFLGLAVSPDNQLVATAYGDDAYSDVRVFDLTTGKEKRHFRRPTTPLSYAFDGTSTRLAISDLHDIHIWNLTNGTELLTDKPTGDNQALFLLSPDGKLLVRSRDFDALRIVNIEKKATLCGPLKDVGYPVAFSPDGSLLAATGRDTILLFKPDCTPIRRIDWPQPSPITDLRFHPGGQLLLAVHGPGSADLLKVSDGTRLVTLRIGRSCAIAATDTRFEIFGNPARARGFATCTAGGYDFPLEWCEAPRFEIGLLARTAGPFTAASPTP